jgi:hypothetical protein
MKLSRSSSRGLTKSSSQGLVVVSVTYDRLLDNAADDAQKRELLASKANVSQVTFSLPASGLVSSVVEELALSLNTLQPATQYTLERGGGGYLPRALPMDRLRAAVKNGEGLRLQVLPMVRATARIEDLKRQESSKKAVFETALALKDAAVAECFVFQDGLPLLVQVLESSLSSTNTIGYALSALYLALSTRAGMSVGLNFASRLIPQLYRFIVTPSANPTVPANAASALFAACAPLDSNGLEILTRAAQDASDPNFAALVKSASSSNVSTALSAINLIAYIVGATSDSERSATVLGLQAVGLYDALGLQSNNHDAGISRVVKQLVLLCSRTNRTNSLSQAQAGLAERAATRSEEFKRATALTFDVSAVACNHLSVPSTEAEIGQVGSCAIIPAKDVVLTGTLGAGSSATVYRGILRHRQEVAVKVLSEPFSNEVMQEVAVMASFASEHVLRLLGVVNALSQPIIVMEYCQRGSLHDVLVKEAALLDWSVALDLLIGAASGVSHLHASKVCHQDVKSLNFMVTDDYKCKISDFGASRALASDSGLLSLSHRPQGTLVYCAPEILLGSAACSFASDVYSFGIVMWEVAQTIATHKYTQPFEEYRDLRFDFQLAVQIGSNNLRPTMAKGTPMSFASLICACWDHDADKRPDTKEVVKSLEAFAGSAKTDMVAWISGTTNTASSRAWKKGTRTRQSRGSSVSLIEYN